jgi:hypothetical protein
MLTGRLVCLCDKDGAQGGGKEVLADLTEQRSRERKIGVDIERVHVACGCQPIDGLPDSVGAQDTQLAVQIRDDRADVELLGITGAGRAGT